MIKNALTVGLIASISLSCASHNELSEAPTSISEKEITTLPAAVETFEELEYLIKQKPYPHIKISVFQNYTEEVRQKLWQMVGSNYRYRALLAIAYVGDQSDMNQLLSGFLSINPIEDGITYADYALALGAMSSREDLSTKEGLDALLKCSNPQNYINEGMEIKKSWQKAIQCVSGLTLTMNPVVRDHLKSISQVSMESIIGKPADTVLRTHILAKSFSMDRLMSYSISLPQALSKERDEEDTKSKFYLEDSFKAMNELGFSLEDSNGAY